MKRDLRIGTWIVSAGMLGAAASMRSVGDGGGSTPAPCSWAVAGDTVTLNSTKDCCASSDCATTYDQSILGESCIGGNVLEDCDCVDAPTTLYQYQNGSCYGSCANGGHGECLFGTLITSVPSTYPICGGNACTREQ